MTRAIAGIVAAATATRGDRHSRRPPLAATATRGDRHSLNATVLDIFILFACYR